ncbi:MAG: hypothetical protein H7A31_00770 [Thermotogae bacterium]|nr:hypothetical protein [Thermotogota bacterium]MCP5465207.1 hypothetical protein [Thermotogota bacterium]
MKRTLLIIIIIISFVFIFAEKTYLIGIDKNLEIINATYDDENIFYVTYNPENGMTEMNIFDYKEKVFISREIYKNEIYDFSVYVSDKYGNLKNYSYYGGYNNAGIANDKKNIYLGINKYFYVFDKRLKLISELDGFQSSVISVKIINGKIYFMDETNGIYSYRNGKKEEVFFNSGDLNIYKDMFMYNGHMIMVGEIPVNSERKNIAFETENERMIKDFDDMSGTSKVDVYKGKIYFRGNKYKEYSLKDFKFIKEKETKIKYYFNSDYDFYVINENNVFYSIKE